MNNESASNNSLPPLVGTFLKYTESLELAKILNTS